MIAKTRQDPHETTYGYGVSTTHFNSFQTYRDDLNKLNISELGEVSD